MVIEPFVIVISHKKGGTGKSSVVMNLSVELNKCYSLTLIDFDFQKQVSKFNQNRIKPMKIKTIKDKTQLVDFAKNGDELIIIDLGGYDSILQRQAILLADLLIIPLNDSDNEEDGLKSFRRGILKDIRELRTDLKGYVLLTRLHHSDKSTHKILKKVIKKTEDLKIFNSTIADISIHKKMLSSGLNVVEMDKNIRAKKDILNLVKEIKELII